MATSMSMSPTGSVDAPAVRAAGRDVLSLALMDARNHTLHLLGALENALGPELGGLQAPEGLPPLWTAGHIAWLAEYWIGRNPQRALGPACPAGGVRLASVDPQADRWFNPALLPRDERGAAGLTLEAVKAYLLDTLETTLELLDKTPEDDAALHFFRMALWHEDLRGEQFVEAAQALGVALPLDLPAGVASREPLGLPAVRWQLGNADPGFAPAIERGTRTVAVPEFEIDAQPVGWAQYVEFIDDGGYDRAEFWQPEGWQWLEAQARQEGRRGPRHVEQIGVASGAVLQTVFGKATRMGGTQNVMHASWWEADAYARWAGRRLPTEVEWEVAAHSAARRGFRWGEVREWTAGTLQPFEGYSPDAWAVDAELDPAPAFGRARVQKGASFAARARMKHVKARAWALPHDDSAFVGFRTCAL
ncbi:SUMF1/EgtB/PvdO family nonheme iron enzyme [Ramlibacter albus]|uniref:SUMF1/EgtB/PvdO family nonheme iron enzyme n=1 Tax=Ramlibacter albus TaxID=2079448 RepID=A0A923MAI7_9BURK|nr:SUMF1/EgtB/PvdO family nonheme iron enzyme [Ramlibacter albus]MBC5766863.1 SUMF1/EgtB/PvdO family nonheme iron enzyme [Ramlibacter albus]